MKETRVNKYKDYRESLIKDGSVSFETPEKEKKEPINTFTTSTLPMDEVLKTLDNGNDEVVFSKKQHRKHILKISLYVGAAVVLIAGLIIFAIFAFK